MDFEGRSDGRSIKSILAHVAPLKLVRWMISIYWFCFDACWEGWLVLFFQHCCYFLHQLLLIQKSHNYGSMILQVLVHGSAEATEHLKQHCLKHVCPHVYAPQIGETIDVTSDLCAYKVIKGLQCHCLEGISDGRLIICGSTSLIGATFREVDEQCSFQKGMQPSKS